jgi:beta-lactam-binding protein with PASTA domain
LKEFIVSNGPLTPEQALPIMRQLVSGISNAHYNGIVHRDIKPQNILMDADGNVKITDFGIAMALSATAHTKTNSVLGTVHYLSPEQARGGMATKKSDIYSLGIVFYELLAGKLPFSGESAVAIALKHLQEETPSVRQLFPSIPQSVENVILKATAKDAANRYRSADEMQEDLATVLSPERAKEKKFAVLYDDDMTRAIPVVNNSTKFESVEETKKIERVEVDEKPAAVKKRKKWPFIVAGISTLIIAALVIALMSGLLGPKKVEVPPVMGIDEKEAINQLEELGFKVEERIEEPSEEFEIGQVIRTVPEAMRKIDAGSPITLYVSAGRETVQMDDHIGSQFSQVAIILANKFKSITPEEIFSDAPIGEIIDQQPEAASDVVPGETEVIFTVSKGKDVQAVENLVGMDENTLAQYEKTSGFTIVRTERHSEDIPAGQVMMQNPEKGKEIEKGGKVEVVVSKGAEKKPVKSISEEVLIEYLVDEMDSWEYDEEKGEYVEVKSERKPQNIRIYIQDKNHTMTDPVKEFTITANTLVTITLELEEGQSGKYQIMRDAMEYHQKKFEYNELE